MQRPENFRVGKVIPLLLALIFIAGCTSEKPEKPAPAAPPAGPTVSLPSAELGAFGALPPLKQEAVTPSFKEPATQVDKAVNVKQVMEFLGVRLTPAQRKFINDHKFLLIPKSATKFKGKVDLYGESDDPFDEMLGLFDYLSGSGDPMNRKPENCRLVNPDVMLQAFHKYFENSLEFLEKTELAGILRRFLTSMQATALEYKLASKGQLAQHYELVAAQLTVPLVILENARWPNSGEKENIATYPPPPPPAESPPAS
jgi:hypothetical protein